MLLFFCMSCLLVFMVCRGSLVSSRHKTKGNFQPRDRVCVCCVYLYELTRGASSIFFTPFPYLIENPLYFIFYRLGLVF